MSNLIKRTVPVILVLLVCISCLVSPVSATDGSSNSDTLFDFFDYNLSDSYFFSNLDTSVSVTFSKPFSVLRYMDLVVYTDYANFSAYFRQDFEVIEIAPQLYRLVWSGMHGNSSVNITFSGSNNANYLNIVSARFSNSVLAGYSDTVGISGYNNLSPNSSFSLAFNGSRVSIPAYTSGLVDGSAYRYSEFDLRFNPSSWQKYDKMSFYFNLECSAINSVTALIDGIDVLDSVSFIDNYGYVDSLNNVSANNITRYMVITIDLSNVDHSSSSSCIIEVTGSYFGYYNFTSFGQFYDCRGYILDNSDNPSIFWLRKLYVSISSGFSNLLSKLDELFGVNDNSVDAAVQTQEELNVSVNNQLVGAVEDWNTNIEVVQTGYDSAVTKATPALGWLASLADRIFTNMGWFGNIYFLVGLISVIMLVLSKSGLARSVSRFRRNE